MGSSLDYSARCDELADRFPVRAPACVAEPDEAARRDLVNTLRLMGFRTHETDTGAVATFVAAQVRLGVFLVNVVLPDSNGLKVIKRVREIAPDTMIVALASTAKAHIPLFMELACHAGADAVLTAPFLPSEVCAALAASPAERQAERQRVPRPWRPPAQIHETHRFSTP